MADLWEDVAVLRERLDKAEAKIKSLEFGEAEVLRMIRQAGMAGSLLGLGLRRLNQALRERGVL